MLSVHHSQKSRVGLSVNKIRQKYSGREVASVAKKLIKSWKKLLPGGYGYVVLIVQFTLIPKIAGQVASRESTPKSNKSGSTSPKSAATPTGVPGKTDSPPPVTYVQQQSDSSQGSGEGNQINGDIPMRRLSSTSDEIILNFPSSVDGFSRTASTGSDVRDRCRDLLAKALKKGSDESKWKEWKW